jgi:hypothetical protein
MQVGRVFAGAVVVAVGLFAIRTLPDLIRYIKMERM